MICHRKERIMPDGMLPSLHVKPYSMARAEEPIATLSIVDTPIVKPGIPDVTVNLPGLLTNKIAAIMKENSPDGFRFVVCDEENILGSGADGFSRMAIDPPQTTAKLEDRINVASLSKTVTAAAVLSTLQAKNLSPDALVAPFFPPDWQLHDEVKKLTFRDFLTHRTGFF
jgi:CubicO group peptidase (beta-lactamase class C family)